MGAFMGMAGLNGMLRRSLYINGEFNTYMILAALSVHLNMCSYSDIFMKQRNTFYKGEVKHVKVTCGNSNDNATPGYCYYKSRGFRYVEGFVRFKRSRDYIAHAWNSDYKGNHFDFTYNDPENFEYFGVVVPEIKKW